MSGGETIRAVVVVAGMGPVGAVLAALLGSRGVDTVVVEPLEGPYPKPRAAVLDGIGSTVRTAAGIGFPGESYPQPWLVVDARARPGAETTADVGDAATVAFVLDSARPAVAMSQRGRRRWEWMLHPGEDPETMSGPDAVRALVADWVEPDDLEIERASVFTFHARMADRWRAERVLLAGDAAHAMPPFAGAGLAMGIRDAAALAWRLTDVVAGADSRLLDGYERERRPDVESLTTLALRIGRIVQTRSGTAMRVTRGALRAVAAIPGLDRLAGRAAPSRRLSRSVAGGLPGAGRVLPNPRVAVAGGPPVRLDEVVGYRWAYIGHGCDPRTVTGDLSPGAVLLALDLPEPAPGCLPLTDPDGLLTGPRGGVTVIRPDRFLHGVPRGRRNSWGGTSG